MRNISKITLSITALFAFALLWLAGAMPAKADTDLIASIVFTPPLTDPNGLNVDDTFIVTVHMASATDQVIDTWGLYLNFDPAVLQANSVTRLYPISGSDFCPVSADFNNTTGQIVGECTDLGGGVAATNLDVMEIEFQVLQTDVYTAITFDQVCDGNGSDDCFQALVGGLNQVAAYNDEPNTPLSVTLQTVGISDETAALPSFSITLIALVLATAVIILFYKRQHNRAWAQRKI